MIINILSDRVVLRRDEKEFTVESRTILWSAGIKASPLGRILAEETGAALDKKGRVAVVPDCTIPGHPEIFVIGDLALFSGQKNSPLPSMAPVAIQQGRYVAGLILRRLAGKSYSPFRYHDRGNMTTIGRKKAVADLHWVYLSGFPAWIVWLFVHLMGLVSFQNRVMVFLQWAWNYFTRNRNARLVTESFGMSGLDRK